MSLTAHAERRLQQRAIPEVVLEWLLHFGTPVQQDGSEVYCLDKASRRRLQRHLGRRLYRRVEDLLDVYVVVSRDGTVITAGHRLERMNDA